MEAAALTLAHDHARKASQDTERARLNVAGNEHELAAEEYRRSIEETDDIEALRILRLLEEHHQTLARIIKAKDEATKRLVEKPKSQETSEDTINITTGAETTTTPVDTAIVSGKNVPRSLFKSDPRRDSSPALAKDMASRRGIPPAQQRRTPGTAPSVSSIQATGKMSAGHTREPSLDTQATEQRRRINQNQAISVRHTNETAQSPDDGFNRFYSNLTSGPLSRISSMLAFAGLPLNESTSPETSPTASKTTSTSTSTSARATTTPDVNTLFSRAALSALESTHPTTFNPAESFYVIPTSGGTASYANILNSRPRGSPHHTRTTSTGTEDDFVDANESLPAPRPSIPLSVREEELAIENAALKQILDKLSHRLQAFESHAQDASMAALTSSMASLRSAPGAAPGMEMEERMRGLTAQLEREMKERERLATEGQRQKAVIAKYRAHWEQLKDSARAKERAKRERGEGGAAA